MSGELPILIHGRGLGSDYGPESARASGGLIDAFWDPEGDYYPVRKFPESRPCHGIKEISCLKSEGKANRSWVGGCHTG